MWWFDRTKSITNRCAYRKYVQPILRCSNCKDAAERWGIIHDRAAVKDKIRKESGKQILAKVDGKYEPSTKTRLDFVSTPEPLDD